MTDEAPDADATADAVAETVGLFQEFGFTEYEARCFVSLSRLESGTAKEVSKVADVPRARVYDCMESLSEHGLVDIQQSKPRRFRAASPDAATALLDRRHERRIERLESLLPRLAAPGRDTSEGDIWVIEGHDQVSERLRALVAEASEEVLLAVAAENLLTDEFVTALIDASGRGVEVTIGSPSEEIRDRLSTALPAATVTETWTWWETHPVQPGAMTSILMVDGDALLASVDAEPGLPDVPAHRAVWTGNHDTPLVGVLRPLLATAITGERH
jgi:sugar-specific transcriptional regulator TrmB